MVIYIYQPFPNGNNFDIKSSFLNLLLMVAGDNDGTLQRKRLVERCERGDFATAGFVVVEVIGGLYGKTGFRHIEIDLDVAIVVEQPRLVGVAVLFHQMDGAEVFRAAWFRR